MTFKNTIKEEREFNLIYRKGKAFYGKNMILRILPNKNNEEVKTAVVVGLKISKKAVLRNKKRRQIQEALKNVIDDIKKGFFVLITAKPEILNTDFKDLEKELKELLSKARLL